MTTLNRQAEWLEPDGLGGFASGTVDGIRTRRYHAILLSAATPPSGRMVLINGIEAWVTTPSGTYALSSQRYAPDVVHPDGAARLEAFTREPWPTWRYRLEDGTRIEQELLVRPGMALTAMNWRLLTRAQHQRAAPLLRQHGQCRLGRRPGVTLTVRPLCSGRDFHALHHENPAMKLGTKRSGNRLVWNFYPGVPAVWVLTNGAYTAQPDWYRNFLYIEEQNRGLDCLEDLASPGVFRWDLSKGEAVWIAGSQGAERAVPARQSAPAYLTTLRAQERRRRSAFASLWHRAADDYLVARGSGKTIIAGYPWFSDWGRDTFIALRGLCLATGRIEEARDILLEWSGTVSKGMLPNRFPECEAAPEYNSVDASLWYVIAVHELLRHPLPRRDQARLRETIQAILSGYANGTRYRIHADADGLLAAGEPGVQLTWMDIKIGDWVVTPRIGKPVEVQALWLNALALSGAQSPQWRVLHARGLASFREKFWNPARGCLYDVVDVDHQPGAVDASLRPNQLFAVGGLPLGLLEPSRAHQVVDLVQATLLTPLGLRSLAPGEPGYAPRYEGGVRERDSAYHQGTAWLWLMGPFVEAWVRVRGNTAAAKRQAKRQFLDPLLEQGGRAGLGHLPEIADAEPPHTPRGCPFQAWSVGEALRLMHGVLVESKAPSTARLRRRGRQLVHA